MPTFAWLARFGRDFVHLTPAQRTRFLAAIAQLVVVEDLRSGGTFRKGLRIKGVQGAPGVFEMTWSGEGRATFEYGDPVLEGHAHILWRRVGTHEVLNQP